MRRLRHSGETEASRSVAVQSHLTSWRPVFTFLILVLVNLQEIVNFNTEGRKGHKSSELRALLFRAEEEDVTSCRSAAANALSSSADPQQAPHSQHIMEPARLLLSGRLLTRFHGARLAKHRGLVGAGAAL